VRGQRSQYRSRTGNLSRMTGAVSSRALPDDPTLAAWASALNDAGYWAEIHDANWRYVFVSNELLVSHRALGSVARVPIGAHLFSAEGVQFVTAQLGGSWPSPEVGRAWFLSAGRFVLASTPGGRDELRRLVAPEFADLVDELQAQEVPVVWAAGSKASAAGADIATTAIAFRLYDTHDRVAGFCVMPKPAAGMSHLAAATATADLVHLERQRVVERPDRHPAAILMGDLEASSPLSRRLSTAQYFAFVRRLIHAADHCIIESGGVVGRHAGDGVVAFFLAETTGSESAAARACITAARTLRDALADIATRSKLAETEVSLRFGLHWGATLYMGRILTEGRSEVTALGDEVNEAARIEASATGGRTLASKALTERLNRADADTLGVDTRHMTYTPLADLATATDKARRDAPSIAVCDV
jgi:class 3 adenylate cyclase